MNVQQFSAWLTEQLMAFSRVAWPDDSGMANAMHQALFVGLEHRPGMKIRCSSGEPGAPDRQGDWCVVVKHHVLMRELGKHVECYGATEEEAVAEATSAFLAQITNYGMKRINECVEAHRLALAAAEIGKFGVPNLRGNVP
jgi:hypothetical protein